MSVIILVVLVFFVLTAGLGGVAYMTYKRKLRRAKAIERGLKMVPILIHLPPPSSDTAAGSRDIREVMREKTAQAEVLYNLLAGTATAGIKAKLYGQRQIGLELIATGGVVHFFAAVPVPLVSVVKQAILTAYPGARLEEAEDHNIFNQEGRLAATMGGEMVLRTEGAYPIATYKTLERDPLEAILTTLTSLQKDDGVAIQVMLRPADPNWVKRSVAIADAKRKGRGANLGFTPQELLQAALKAPSARREDEKATGVSVASNLELEAVEQIEEKTKHPGFDTLIRVVVSTDSVARSQQKLRDLATAFALFDAPGLNGFKFLPALDVQGLVTAFIFRFFPPELKGGVLASEELATLFHLPDSQFTPSAAVERMQSKQVDGPIQVSPVGLLFGYNEFRGVQKEIRLSPEDRRRHTYILGQTGTGKSTMLENLAVQDMLAGNGFAFIDPHGDSAEKLLALVPKERAEDVIYFNPADLEYPVGLNLFEFNDPSQKDFIVQETINMLYKLYDPGHTGIIGPRYEHWYRNAALTLMSDPNGSTFIEIPKVFTDTEYLKQKFKYLRDPTVIDFWTKEMGQTSDYHKSEMLGWFVSKFGAFQNNEMMRNIIGQTQSAFNLREVMDQKRILIVNLSKGRIGELNSQLLGMIFVIKFQAAAMSRAEVPEDQRPDFSLYVDEFQNFSTDSFASILSEARKYRLNLIVANQFIGQLKPEIRDAVFGNIGTIVAHRMGPEDAEFMVKQFSPVFDAGDLVNIPNFNAAMRLMIGGLPSQPFTVRDSAPLGNANLELGVAIKQLSAAKFGRARAQVERDIFARMSGRPVVAPSSTPPPPNVPVPGSATGGFGPSQTTSPAPAPVVPSASAPAPGLGSTPNAPGASFAMDPAGAVGPVPTSASSGAALQPMSAPQPLPVVPSAAAVPPSFDNGAAGPMASAPVPISAPAAVAYTEPASVNGPSSFATAPLLPARPVASDLTPAAAAAKAATTLSFRDITGGKPPQRSADLIPVLMPDATAPVSQPAPLPPPTSEPQESVTLQPVVSEPLSQSEIPAPSNESFQRPLSTTPEPNFGASPVPDVAEAGRQEPESSGQAPVVVSDAPVESVPSELPMAQVPAELPLAAASPEQTLPDTSSPAVPPLAPESQIPAQPPETTPATDELVQLINQGAVAQSSNTEAPPVERADDSTEVPSMDGLPAGVTFIDRSGQQTTVPKPSTPEPAAEPEVVPAVIPEPESEPVQLDQPDFTGPQPSRSESNTEAELKPEGVQPASEPQAAPQSPAPVLPLESPAEQEPQAPDVNSEAPAKLATTHKIDSVTQSEEPPASEPEPETTSALPAPEPSEPKRDPVASPKLERPEPPRQDWSQQAQSKPAPQQSPKSGGQSKQQHQSKREQQPNNQSRLSHNQGSNQNDDMRRAMAERIDKLEKQIDDLVGTSLLGANQHRRLPEPAFTPLASQAPKPDAALSKQQLAELAPLTEHPHSLKVIEPVEPIESQKEELQRQVAALEQAEQAQAAVVAPVAPAASSSTVTAPEAETPVSPSTAPIEQAQASPLPPAAAEESAEPEVPRNAPDPEADSPIGDEMKVPAAVLLPPKPETSEPALKPEVEPPAPPLPEATTPQAETAIVKHNDQMMGLPPAPPSREPEDAIATSSSVVEDDAMPAPQSLAADDVAKARAEREAAQKAIESPPPSPKSDSQQDRRSDSGNRNNGKNKRRRDNNDRNRHRDRGEQSQQQPASEPVAPSSQQEPASQLQPEAQQPRQAEPTPQQPADEQSVLTGKLIMPSAGSKPAEFEEPKLEKPKKLAPGEVFVDEKGNVMIGE